MALMGTLPQEVLSVLPSDYGQQLELANKIISHAFSSRVSQAEGEAGELRELLLQQKSVSKTLERRVAHLETELQDMHAKNKVAVEENHKLQTEKGALIETVKRLNREVVKLEAFKKNLIQQLQDEDGEPGQSKLDRAFAAVDLSSERLVNEVLTAAKAGPSGGSGPGAHVTMSFAARGNSPAHAGFSGRSNYRAPAPSQLPPRTSTSPRGYGSGAGGGGGGGYGSHPTSSSSVSFGFGSAINGGGDSHEAHSYGASGSSSPQMEGQGREGSPTPRLDGKEFFRQARARLSYDEFSQFLTNIKELNAGRITREEALRRSRELFGAAQHDLYVQFESLLSRHINAF